MISKRPIKFRAWHEKKKEWMFGYKELGGFSLFGEIIMLGEFGSIPLEELNDICAMQFTGLKDKNEKEIYEGDIVRCSISKTQHYKGIIEYKKAHFYIRSFGYVFNKMGRWDQQKSPLSGKCNTALNIDCTIDKIIGNVFDNPELLEKKNGA